MRAQSILISLLLLGACAPGGEFPSLAPRPIEKLPLDEPEPAELPPASSAEASPALREQLGALVNRATSGEAAFATAAAAAERAAARAGGSGSDSWKDAQIAFSRAQTARGATNDALADIDVLAPAAPRSRADLAAIAEAQAAIQAIADRQQTRVDAIRGRLGF